MKTIKDLILESRVCSTGYIKVDRILSAFSKSLTRCMDRLIDSGESFKLCDGFKFTTYNMSAAQFESGIRIPRKLKLPDYILSIYKADVVVLEDLHYIPLYVELPDVLWGRLIDNIGKINRINRRYGTSVKDTFSSIMTYMNDEKKDMLFEDLSKFLFNYLVKLTEPISFDTEYGNMIITTDRPPRGYDGYDYQSDISMFNGFYYIPIDYTMMRKIKFGYVFHDVKITTSRASLLGKHRYAVKAFDDKFKGNVVWLPKYRIGKYDIIELGEYIKK